MSSQSAMRDLFTLPLKDDDGRSIRTSLRYLETGVLDRGDG